MTVDPRVYSICAEYGIRIVDAHRYPDIGETRAVATMDRILRNHGEGHFRLVMTTLAETANNKACLDEFGLWMTSDMVIANRGLIERDTSAWLELWDAIPLGRLQFIANDLSGITPQRHAISGMVYERVFRRFGPNANQLDLLDDRRTG
ncbi:hypothetical protein RI570_11430 [Brucella pseudogrignonensis]|uniref:hypothetical protein n=1 Tax=Brucella pseudogrignonensis TaxID=419475 RepID=UPI0028B28106|nr:hypothetical protein [Brucella pseudogrignonensis]MDT6940759.1 hypothetical protein [Brucella pseudogrignonensis]